MRHLRKHADAACVTAVDSWQARKNSPLWGISPRPAEVWRRGFRVDTPASEISGWFLGDREHCDQSSVLDSPLVGFSGLGPGFVEVRQLTQRRNDVWAFGAGHADVVHGRQRWGMVRAKLHRFGFKRSLERRWLRKGSRAESSPCLRHDDSLPFRGQTNT